MKIIVLGGDGFCGWAASLHLAKNGHEVLIIDNLSRRSIDSELSTNSLTPIAEIEERIKVANDEIGKITFKLLDVAKDYHKLKQVIRSFIPSAIVHFAEQRSAPYSMISEDQRRYTIDNNTSTTHNILSIIAEVDKDIHLVHLGTMGVYGYDDRFGEIPEGYLDITIKSTQKSASIIYPPSPGSVYHLTKVLDHYMLQYYSSNWGIKITDLHQGVVWGTQTEETRQHESLINRFDYDGDYGTVVNRFLMQATIGHPLTVHGTGGQTRAMIHIGDMAKCIRLAVEDRIDFNGVRVFNQIAETVHLNTLAKKISSITGVDIMYMDNPRNESDENNLKVSNKGLRSIGFKPTLLNDELMNEVREITEVYKHRVIKDKIIAKTKWK
jgi:UDP-sulfoquinovose synthase